MRIDYLMLDPTARGGIVRSTFTMAGALAALGHRVRIVGLLPGAPRPALPWPQGVESSTLVVRRPRTGAAWAPENVVPFLRTARGRRRPSSLVGQHDSKAWRYSRATDKALARYLLETDADVVLGTRSGLNLAMARLPRRAGLRVVGLEHMGLHRAGPRTKRAYCEHLPSLDAIVSLTPRDRRRYRELLGPGPIIRAIPNAIAVGEGPVNGLGLARDPVVAAGGRLVAQKGFDLLLEAWALVATRFPGWQLRIYGDGPLEGELAKRAAAPDLAGRVRLAGFTADLPRELSRAEVFVLSSRFEGMPMVLLEAMAAGSAVVAFDCPTGPGQLIRHERDGLLVPPASVPALADALARVLDDDALRHLLGVRARHRAGAFNLVDVARRWERLLDALTQQGPEEDNRPSERRGPWVRRPIRSRRVQHSRGSQDRGVGRSPVFRAIERQRIAADTDLAESSARH